MLTSTARFPALVWLLTEALREDGGRDHDGVDQDLSAGRFHRPIMVGRAMLARRRRGGLRVERRAATRRRRARGVDHDRVPSAEALATQRSTSCVSRCSVSRRRSTRDRGPALMAAIRGVPRDRGTVPPRGSAHRLLHERGDLLLSAAVNFVSANEVGHIAPASRFAASLNPNVAYLESNFAPLWKKQTTLPSSLAYAGIPYHVFGERPGALSLTIAWSRLAMSRSGFRHLGDLLE